MEYMCFNQNQKGDISTLKNGSLKLMDKFTYLGSSISSTENDINTGLEKAWTVINRLSVIWKSDLSNKMKSNFFPGNSQVQTTIWMHHMDADKASREKTGRQLHKNAASCNVQFLEAISLKIAAIQPLPSSLWNHPSPTNKTCWTLPEK